MPWGCFCMLRAKHSPAVQHSIIFQLSHPKREELCGAGAAASSPVITSLPSCALELYGFCLPFRAFGSLSVAYEWSVTNNPPSYFC